MFKLLGIWFTQDLKECAAINRSKNIDEVKKLFKISSLETVTPLGRVAILKSLILSKLCCLTLLKGEMSEDISLVYTLHLLVSQVRDTVGDSGLCCCVCVTSLER